MKGENQRLKQIKQANRKREAGYKLESVFGPNPGEFILNIKTNRMERLAEIKFTPAEHAMITILEQATEDIWARADNETKKQNLLAWPKVYVAIFSWGGMQASELLPSLRGFMKAFMSKTKKEPPAEPELRQILL